jgi:tetratricopeptide (TPR) repeat protein
MATYAVLRDQGCGIERPVWTGTGRNRTTDIAVCRWFRPGIFCGQVYDVTGAEGDPVKELRAQLQDLFEQVRRPTYRGLARHADRAGLVLRISTIGDLLNGPRVPRWETVEAFVRACAGHARVHRIEVPAPLLDLRRWHTDYRTMQDALIRRGLGPETSGARRAGRRERRVVPAQLPADVPAFTGRTRQLADLDELLTAARAPATVVISAIDGTAGIGKTALAVHWAHRVADQFPDGQLYVNLRGFHPDGSVVDPSDALRGFLDGLQVDAHRIPTSLDAQAALYRSLLVSRRLLIVLDNARDSDQVRPLLPGSPGCLVVITSRNLLTGLQATHGAHPLTLDLLTESQARELLTQRLGATRIEAEPAAVDELISACARLPLALAIAAARAQQTGFALATLAAELRDARHRLDALDTGDPTSQIRTVFSWSTTTLTSAAARLFRLLGLHPGADIDVLAAASLAGQPVPETRRLLAELTRGNLLTEHLPGRYLFHDLLRAYATEQTHALDTDRERHDATTRLLDHYLHTAHAAARLFDPPKDVIDLIPAQPGVSPHRFTDDQQALDWFATERTVLIAAIEHAEAAGYDTHTWQLAWSMWTFLYRQGHHQDCAVAGRAAVAAAGRLADPEVQLRAHRILAHAYTHLDRFADAESQLQTVLDLATAAGDLVGQGHAQRGLILLWNRRGDPRRALQHARQAVDLFQRAGHIGGQARALNSVGEFRLMLGEHEQALIVCKQALALQQDIGDAAGQAGTWENIGYAHHHRGDYAEAITCYRHALTLYREVGDRYYEPDTLIKLGETHHAVGDLGAARDAWQQALTILDYLGRPEAGEVRAKLATLDPPPS